VDSLCNTLPQWKDTRYIMIGGNHDYSFMKMNGHNVIQAAAGKRKDFVYAGFDQAEIPLIERDHQVKASAVLWHPSGGVPYALSYRGQKFAAEVTRDELAEVVMDEKPSPTVRFVIWGHLHVADWFPYGPIEVFGPGCFEGTNGYLKAKGLRPTIRGLIVEADIAENGLIASTHIHPLNFMEREDDYHAAYNPMLAREAKMKIEPVFSFQPHL
jgi:predicted phosphodiesterase